MRTILDIEQELESLPPATPPREGAQRLLRLAEQVLEAWLAARDEAPAMEEREGFRLLALHHQGAHGTPSFNACRETCREIAYHYNVLTLTTPQEPGRALGMMAMLVRHLALFVGGKLQVEGLGEFCCASKPLRQEAATMAMETNEGERHA